MEGWKEESCRELWPQHSEACEESKWMGLNELGKYGIWGGHELSMG